MSRRKVVIDEPLRSRVERTERVLGTLLTFLFARGITSLEDFGKMMDELRGANHGTDSGREQPDQVDRA